LPSWKIPLYKIYWDEDDVERVSEVIRQGMFWAIGPNIEKFERMVAERIGKKYAMAFNSGTSALHAILLAYGIKQGDEVIVPSFTFIATANSVLFVGAEPVFADIERDTYGLHPEDVKKKITDKTKVIMPIHYGGLPCHIRELKEIAEDHKLLLIEDAAESLGANIDGKPVGSFGDAAMFSFCGNKVITTGEGGMIATDQRDIYEKLKLIRSHGRLDKGEYFTSIKTMDYITLGYNWRMSNITAALGISQLKKLDKLIAMRRKNTAYLSKRLSNVSRVELPNPPNGYFHVYQMYTIKIKNGKETRDGLKNYLAEKGVMTKVYFFPIHLKGFYRDRCGFRGGELPVTEELSKQVLTLPMYASLTIDEMNFIADHVKVFMEKRD
jgi:perosamine synthetase